MPPQATPQFIQRASIDGSLCTIRCTIGKGQIPGTKGEWLGIEWDDPARGKHDGTYEGKRYFSCQSIQSTVASFIRPSRKLDAERTVIEAIKHRYGEGSSSPTDVVIISGKVAEEVGFDKITQEQSILADLKILVLEKLQISGIAPRHSSRKEIEDAQAELLAACPNAVELDLGYNTIDSWQDVCDICVAFPKLRVLRLNGLRLRVPVKAALESEKPVFGQLRELQLNETLLKPQDSLRILGDSSSGQFPNLLKLWLSQNEIEFFPVSSVDQNLRHRGIKELILENNFFTSLDCLGSIIKSFPALIDLSLQRNRVETVYGRMQADDKSKIIRQFLGLESLTVSRNQIKSFEFVDEVAAILPDLTALRISDNPIYDAPCSNGETTNPSETSYYLTLARIPSLRTLNYSQITSREREEGEIYYLSIAEQEIRSLVSAIDLSNDTDRAVAKPTIERKHPQYQRLSEKYDRESIVTKLFASSSEVSAAQILDQDKKPKYPAGSIAAQLIQATFYLAVSNSSQKEFTWAIPSNSSTSQVFALVARRYQLLPLQFKLTHESRELDPVREDLTTRSQLYNNDGRSAAERYRSWGAWDADQVVEAETNSGGTAGVEDNSRTGEEVSRDGFVLRDGKRWKRRETEILMSFRPWADWLDADITEARIRVDPFPGHTGSEVTMAR